MTCDRVSCTILLRLLVLSLNLSYNITNTQRGLEMKKWLQRFMSGRYGQDNLNNFLSIFALILCIISIAVQSTLLNSLVLVLLFFCFFRMFSRDWQKRQEENLAFLRAEGKLTQYLNQIKLRLHQRKTHRFYNCPSCKQHLRVPKGKGLITIHCPKCKTSFNKKT